MHTYSSFKRVRASSLVADVNKHDGFYAGKQTEREILREIPACMPVLLVLVLANTQTN